MTGTLINTATILAGSLLGLMLGSRLQEKTKTTVLNTVSLVVLYLGIETAAKGNNLVAILLGLVLGSVIGEALQLEEHLNHLGQAIEKKLKASQGRFATGFVTATLLFCVGPMAILGSLQDGLRQGYNILLTKATLDGLSSVALSASLGIGVSFSACSVLIYQGILTLLASCLGNLATAEVVASLSGAGGILIIGIGFNMLGLTKIKTANLLPGLILAPLITLLF